MPADMTCRADSAKLENRRDTAAGRNKIGRIGIATKHKKRA
jgi:hypothetical protein